MEYGIILFLKVWKIFLTLAIHKWIPHWCQMEAKTNYSSIWHRYDICIKGQQISVSAPEVRDVKDRFTSPSPCYSTFWGKKVHTGCQAWTYKMWKISLTGNWPAFGQECYYCGHKNHWASMCRTERGFSAGHSTSPYKEAEKQQRHGTQLERDQEGNDTVEAYKAIQGNIIGSSSGRTTTPC